TARIRADGRVRGECLLAGWRSLAGQEGEMSKRKVSSKLTLIVPAMLTWCLIGVASNSRMTAAEPAEQDCLPGPNAVARDGSHWYYRVDREKNRQCWYLAPLGKKVRQSAASATQPSPQTSAPPIEGPSEAAASTNPVEPIAAANVVLTLFSEAWPSLPN